MIWSFLQRKHESTKRVTPAKAAFCHRNLLRRNRSGSSGERTYRASSVVASQADCMPNMVGVSKLPREHIKSIYVVVKEALQQVHLDLKELDAVAVTRTRTRRLLGSGNEHGKIAAGRRLAAAGTNHLEGHLYSAWIQPEGVTLIRNRNFPAGTDRIRWHTS